MERVIDTMSTDYPSPAGYVSAEYGDIQTESLEKTSPDE